MSVSVYGRQKANINAPLLIMENMQFPWKAVMFVLGMQIRGGTKLAMQE
jgi:hypothetical protein